ncbi:MAG: carbohydrate ABC transporter permease [Lentisphaeria bacterium]
MNSAFTKTTRRRIAFTLSYLFLITVGVTMIFPFLWMVLTSVKAPDADVMNLKRLLPEVSYSVTTADIRDWPMLCRILNGSSDLPHAGMLSEALRPGARRYVRKAVERGEIYAEEKPIVVAALNTMVNSGELWMDAGLSTQFFDADDRALAEKPEMLTTSDRRRLNRIILDAVLGNVITKARRIHISNYRTAFTESNLLRAFLNSLLVTCAVTFGLVLTSSLAAYAFARLEFAGRDKIFLGYLATLMVPATVTMIPVFILLEKLGMVDSYSALILPAMFSAYGTFMLRQFFMTLPRSLEESAVLDGCSALGVYWHIILPLSKPGLTALAILTFMESWRSFMWPLIVAHSEDIYTLPVALAAFQEIDGVHWTLLMAGSMLMIIPMLVVFVFGQRFFVEGITLGAVKG